MSPTREANDGNATLLQEPKGAAGLLAGLRTRVLVADGAMGTMLHSGGVSLDRSLPELSLSQPDLVRAIHRAYIAAGAHLIETNTFGASRFRLARHGLQDRVAEINRAGARVAREARERAGASSVLVAGSVAPATPTASHAQIPAADLRAAFEEQIAALVEAGVDLLMFETFSSLSEMVEAVGVAQTVGSLPIVAQMTFVEDGRTLTGDTPAEVAQVLESLAVAAIGANCVLGPQGLLDVLRELARHTSLPLAAQPNAGPPTLLDGRFRYTADPAYFARYTRSFVQAGAALVGGCCGTTPAHIEAVASAVRGLAPGEPAPTAGPLADGPRRTSRRAETLLESRGSARTGNVGEALPAPPPARRASVVLAAPRSDTASAATFVEKLRTGMFAVTCEIAPPESGDAERALEDVACLRAAGCDAVVVAPVKSTRAQVSSTSLALLIQQRVPELDAILTVTTWDRSVIALQADLLGAHAFGLRHVICRTGTPPLQGDYPNVAGVWDIDGLGLSQMLQGLNEGRDHHGTPLGRPTAFVIGARIHPAADDFERQVRSVRAKIDAGASYLISPPVFDVDALARLLDAADAGDLPVLLGIMPLRDFRQAEYLQHEVPDMAVPEALLQRMWKAGPRGAEVGMEIALELVETARARGHIHGVAVSSGTGSADEMVRLLGMLAR
ncbi:MAG: bifunctional homocysteine S-methyltransferase/methylenetetrahydrofolate reductase [Chloroflexota bacterium]